MSIRILQITIILIAIISINSVSGLIKADIHKRKGKESLKDGFHHISVNEFNKALKLDKSDGESMGYLGTAYTSLAEIANNTDKKRELLKKAIYEMTEGNKTYEAPSFSHNFAKTYELSGDLDNAIKEAVRSYNQIPSEETKNKLIFLYKKMGDILLAQNKKDEAIKYYTKVVELKMLNVINEDIAGYEFLRDIMPDNFFVHYNLARLYMNQNLWEKAAIELEYINNKIAISNEDIMLKLIQIYYNLGNKYYTEKKFREAERYLNFVIDYDGISRFGYTIASINILSQIYEQSGSIDKAAETLLKLEQIDTQKGQGYYQIAQLYNRKSNLQKTIEYFEKYLPYRHISDVSIFSTLGSLYEHAGDIDKAVETLMKLEGIDTQKGQGYYQIGNLFNRKSNPQKAIEYFEKYLSFRPISDTSIFYTLGSLYEQVGNIDKAIEMLLKLEDIDTNKGQGYYQIGRMFNRKSNPQKAIEYFEKYLPFRSISDADIFITLGNLYKQIGDIDKAVENYSRLDNFNSYREQGHYYIGLLYEKKERWSDALKEFEYVLKIKPNDSQILIKIGEVYEKMGNNKKALEIYKKAIALDPIKEIELNHAIARCYEKIGEREMALSILKRIEN